jgi:mutator protein MutT
MPPPIDVAAGLVFRDGKLLITQRPADAHLGNLWEFPGGKREPGETFEACLTRELREELGMEAEVGNLIEELTHDYPGVSVRLRFYHCRWRRHEPRPLHCRALAWVEAGQLERYEFPAADARLLARLRQEWAALAEGGVSSATAPRPVRGG